jgi:hypothetical protein
MATVKQKWAHERNWNKARITAMVTTARNIAQQDSTVKSESMILRDAADDIQIVLNGIKRHETESRNQYVERRNARAKR